MQGTAQQGGAVKPIGAVGALKNQRKAARKGQPGQKQVSCWEGHATAITKALILGFASLWFALHEGRKVYELSRHAVNIPRNGLRKKVRDRFGHFSMLNRHTSDRIYSIHTKDHGTLRVFYFVPVAAYLSDLF